ncbi:MAG: Ig-like domain-containing protein [Clostridia bacterium]
MKKLISFAMATILLTFCISFSTANEPEKSTLTTMHAFSIFYHDSHYMGGPNGFISFSAGNPEDAAFNNGFVQNSFIAGDYYDGFVYAYRYSAENAYEFVKTNMTDYSETVLSVGSSYASEMAYDYTTDTMYAVLDDSLYMVSLTDGATTLVGISGIGDMLTLACSGEGTLYSVGANCSLYSLSKTNGAATLIGETGIEADNLQSMTWDYASGTLYWASVKTAPLLLSYYTTESKFCSVNIETGSATVIGNIYGSNMQVTCLYAEPEGYVHMPPESMTLNLEDAYLLIDQTAQLSAYVMPKTAERGVTYLSDNENVVTVGDGGLLTATGIGDTVVTVTSAYAAVSKQCNVHVITPEHLSEFTLNDACNGKDNSYNFTNSSTFPYEVVARDGRIAAKSTMHGNNQYALISFDAGYLLAGSKVKFDWKNDATYMFHGFILYANVPYTANLTGQTGWLTYEYTIPTSGNYAFTWSFWKDTSPSTGEDCGFIDNIRVEPAVPSDVTGVSVNPTEISIYDDMTYQLNAVVEPMNAANTNISWSSDNENVASVNEVGLVTAVAPGTVNITATTEEGGFTASSAVTVIDSALIDAPISAALNTENGTLSFKNDRLHPWLVDEATFEGRIAVISDISGLGNTSTTISLNDLTLDAGDILSFDYTADSESENYDYIAFYVNGTLYSRIGGAGLDWQNINYCVPENGTYDFTWIYVKDRSGNTGRDAAWLDNVTLTRGGEIELGDANGDGAVNSGDVSAILQLTVGLIAENDIIMQAADINMDSIVNTGDAALLLELILA